MIDVAILSVIRRWHLREGVSIREISRRTKLSRNTIRKYLTNGAVEAVYPKRRNRSKLDGYAEKLASWLKRESVRGRKERRNLKQLHRDLMKCGYTGSYDRVAAFSRVWRRQRQEASTVSMPAPFDGLCGSVITGLPGSSRDTTRESAARKAFIISPHSAGVTAEMSHISATLVR